MEEAGQKGCLAGGRRGLVSKKKTYQVSTAAICLAHQRSSFAMFALVSAIHFSAEGFEPSTAAAKVAQ